MKDQNNKITSELSRELNLFHITMMGLGMMIGAGIFIGVGNSISYAGPGGVVLTFTLNGLLAIFTAMSYAELSSAIPKAGGAYNFARIGFGKGTSFIAGWMEWFASSLAGSLYAVTFSEYVVRFFDDLNLLNWYKVNFMALEKLTNKFLYNLGILKYYISSPELVEIYNIDELILFEKIVAILIAVIFLYINFRGASETGKIGALFTFGQILFLVIIGLVGIIVTVIDPERLNNFKPFMPNGWIKLLATMGLTYVAFEGYEVIAQAGDETINPKKNLPKAILLSVLIVTLIYVSVAFTTVVSVKMGKQGVNIPVWQWISQYKQEGFGEAISKLMPYKNLGNIIVTLAVICASTSALNATIYSATRSSYALGRDRMLPKSFSKISRKNKTPYIALLSTGIIIICVALLPTHHVAASASFMFLCLFFLVNICVIKIRRDMGDELHYGFLIPLFPLFPILAIILQPLLIFELREVSKISWIIAPSWLIIGFIVYFIYSKKRIIPSEDEIHILEEEKATSGDSNYHIMVSVSNPKNVYNLVTNTYKICKAKNAKVELLHMVPVPIQVTLHDAEKYILEGKEGIVEAMLYLAPLFPLSTTIRYCRNIARGIVNAIKEKKIDMLIMGWHGKSKKYWYSLGSTIDPVIERSPCNVVIMKDCANKKFKNILVPISGGPNSIFALEIANIILDKKEGKITALTVNNENHQFDLKKFIEKQKERLNLSSKTLKSNTIISNDTVNSILEEANNYDIIILGSTYKNFIFQMTGNTIPEKIAKKYEKPLIMVKSVRKKLRDFLNTK